MVVPETVNFSPSGTGGSSPSFPNNMDRSSNGRALGFQPRYRGSIPRRSIRSLIVKKLKAIVWMFLHGFEYLGVGQFVKFKNIHRDNLGFRTIKKENIVIHELWEY